jgi:hypothetical protein
MQNLTITIYADPGHAWAQVPHTVIRSLGIGAKISAYSYRDQANAYLEEDCDLALFIHACQEKGISFSFNEQSTNQDSPIRNKTRY